jgi:hypothetical protein
MSRSKKEWHVGVRLPTEVKEQTESVAKKLGQSVGGLARILLESFVAAHSAHAGHLPWPPKFQHYSAAPVEKAGPEAGDCPDIPLYLRGSRNARPVTIAADPRGGSPKIPVRESSRSGG